MKLLNVQDLSIQFKTDNGIVHAVNGATLSLKKGETLGLVGETGAGKTTTALGIMRLIQVPPGIYAGGSIEFEGEDIFSKSEAEMRKIRGKKITMIFQDPMTALNPIMPVGDQIAEVIRLHDKKITTAQAQKRACDMLVQVGIPAERFGEYPHQFSGGMKQRIVIAIALACNPELLIADEPTTALDVTIQAQVLAMMAELKERFQTSMILITHDLGVVAEICDTVAIMYAGQIVEYGTLEDIYEHTAHPYTKGLFGSIPSLVQKVKRLNPIKGSLPDPTNLPEGCPFHPRCPYAAERCRQENPCAMQVAESHMVRCWNPLAEKEPVHE